MVFPIIVNNVVCVAQLQTEKTFEEFLTAADKAYTHRPTMALFKRRGATILIFTSKKLRIMGLPAGSSSSTSLQNLVASHHQTLVDWILEFNSFPSISLQNFSLSSATMTHKVPALINFYKNRHYLEYELELFSGAKFKLPPSSSCHVNVFSNGQVVATGMKSEQQMQQILHQLYSLMQFN